MFDRLTLIRNNPTKWSNTLKQFVGKSHVFDHFVGLALKVLTKWVYLTLLEKKVWGKLQDRFFKYLLKAI